MNVSIKGKGNYSLNKADFVASGGEGAVYCKGDIAFKIYTDAKKMLPIDKIRELGVLTLSNVIRPQDVVLDSRNKPIGYTMRFLKDTYALCQLFPKAFRERMGVKPDDVVGMVKKLQAIVSHCHDHDVLIVDLNEYNFLVNDSFDEVFAIDCDSYQTKSFKAPVIMDSIRDRHATGPTGRYNANENTDWFSFGVVTFQMFIGVHPFKGKHPTLKGLDERMLNNVSVLNSEVGVPPICYPVTNIPQAYRDWYKAVFEEGKRIAPPADMQAVIVVAQKVHVAGSNNFIIRKVQVFKDNVVRFDTYAHVTLTESAMYTDARKECDYKKMPAVGVSASGKILAASIAKGKLKVYNVSRGQEIETDLDAEAVMSYNGRIYYKIAGKMCELKTVEIGGTIYANGNTAAQVSGLSSTVFDGVVIQDALGACFATVFPEEGSSYQIHLKELDGIRIVDAKYDNRVMMLLVYERGHYNKHIYRFNAAHDASDHRTEDDTGTIALNFVTLPTGICLHMNEKEELELFTHDPKSSSVKTFADPALTGDIKLTRNGTGAMFSKGNELYSFEVKKAP